MSTDKTTAAKTATPAKTAAKTSTTTAKPAVVKAVKPVKEKKESDKISRSLGFKALVYSLHLSGLTSKQSFIEACAQMKVPVSPGMEQYPGSYMFDYKRTLVKNANSNDAEIVKLFTENNLKYNKASMTIGIINTVANPQYKSVVITAPVKQKVASEPKVSAAVVAGPKVVKRPVVTETTVKA